MKQEITVRVRRGDKLVKEDAILWTGEVPPEYLPGQNRRMKNRRHKQVRMAQQLEERLAHAALFSRKPRRADG